MFPRGCERKLLPVTASFYLPFLPPTAAAFPKYSPSFSERTDFPFQKFPFSWPQGPKGKKWEKRKEGDYSIFQECGSVRESLCALIRFNFFFRHTGGRCRQQQKV